ncbi:rRNA-processing protein [Mycoemilia scoparia]|uniref:rRNA-processing protein n=1 Tax=Mycoemilia scoparia TaxID=417184 RepID=A0A9W8A8B1_9FUNG|nr:rRNA-processing protein [Mycoemilia scoparia]
MISALCWVRRGVAKEYPQKYEMTEEEFNRINNIVSNELEEAKADLDESKSEQKENKKYSHLASDPELAGLNMENYDDTDEESEDEDGEQKGPAIFSNVKGLAYHESNAEDPYITMKDEDDDSEKEETRILSTDNMLLAAKTEDNISQMEVFVFESEEDHLYNHHDIMLPEFPLCLEWLGFPTGSAQPDAQGNFVAVGTFSPDIEIWDLDVVDAMYPKAVLGNPGGKNKRKNKGKPHNDYHTDAVMGLSWNRLARNILASSSADTTVKLWDLATTKCVRSFDHHKDKVQAVQWHPLEQAVILTGSYDKSVAVFDTRSPQQITRWGISADVESIAWDHHSPANFYAAIEDGTVQYFDVRTASNGKGGAPVFTIHAHDKAVSAFDVHPAIPGCIVTGSIDKTVKIWSVKDNKPSMVTSRTLNVGNVFTAKFCPDSPFQLAVSGSRGQINVWDISTNSAVRSLFRSQGANIPDTDEKPLVDHSTLAKENDSDDDDEDEENDEAELAQQGGMDVDSDNDEDEDSDDA